MFRRKLCLTVGALAVLGLGGPAFADHDDDAYHARRPSPIDRLRAKLPHLGDPFGDDDLRHRRDWERERSHEYRAPYGVPYDQSGQPYAAPPAPEDSDRYAPPPEDRDDDRWRERYNEDDRYPPRWPYRP